MRNIRSLAGGDATMNATSHLDPRLRKQLLAVAARPDSNLGEAIQRLAAIAAATHRSQMVESNR